ncbi:PAS domain-containing protein [Chryseolinea lacunae]|uniref:PAS domain-containing protein n=1 Tax=Chryseolinea lacunae TaxID=2801331 RepID=A0ABS1L1R3_9BACT|nr:PAS domain-containing protein [Chryseolinea lacunae]MBL0745653.1 PAS domain-containing protein [Chryseolinea lacunae]
MKEYLNKLIHLGHHVGMDQSERARLVSINAFLVMSLFLTVAFVLVFVSMGSLSVLQALGYVPMLLLVLFLHSRFHFRAARILVSYGFMCMVLTLSILERRAGTEYLLIALGCCSVVVFNKLRNVVFSFLFAFLCYVAYQWYDSHEPFVPNPTVPYPIAQNSIMFLSGFIVLAQSLVFRWLIRDYAEKLAKANLDTQVINEELQATNEELTAFSENLDLMVRQKSAQLQAYIDAIDVSIYSTVSDLDGNFIKVNEQVLAISGYTQEELVGKHYNLLASGNHPEAFFDERRQVLMQGKTWRGEVEHKTKQGTLLWFDCIVIPIRDSNGVIRSFLTLGLSITERKLHDKLQEETITLLESIAFRASHGIRGPLARINGLSHLVIKNVVDQNEFELIAEKLIICSQELDEATSELVKYVYNHQELMMDNRQNNNAR